MAASARRHPNPHPPRRPHLPSSHRPHCAAFPTPAPTLVMLLLLAAPTATATTATSEPAAPAVSTTAPSTPKPARELVVFLREQCDEPGLNMTALRQLVRERAAIAPPAQHLDVRILDKSELCGVQPGELSALLTTLSAESTRAVLGSFEAALCGVLDLLATMHEDKTLVTWGCPQQELLPGVPEEAGAGAGGSRVLRLLPPLATLVQGSVRVATYYHLRTAAIVSSGSGWWQLAAQALDLALRAADIQVRYRVLLPPAASDDDDHTALQDALRPLLQNPVRVVVLCLPMRSPLWTRAVSALDRLHVVHLPATVLLALHPTSATPFMAHDPAEPPPPGSPRFSDVTTLTPSLLSTVSSRRKSRSVTAAQGKATTTAASEERTATRDTQKNTATTSAYISTTKMRSPESRPLLPVILPARSWSEETQAGLLVLTALDSDLRLEDAFVEEEGCPDRSCPQLQAHLELWHFIQRGWDLVLSRGSGSRSRAPVDLVLLDWVRDSTWRWRPLLEVLVGSGNMSGGGVAVRALFPRGWPHWKRLLQLEDTLSFDVPCEADAETSCEPSSDYSFITSNRVGIAVVVISCVIILILVVVAGVVIRQHLLRKRMSKGPCKILLTPNDFVFPHPPEARRVDEGMEAMLCCWLQQLQEFGGPEVDKPEMLKGSIGSLKSLHPPPNTQGKSPESTGSVGRTTAMDPKARYNGDLVQLKEFPVSGTFELKTKAMDVLLMIHGLRHENLNPLIGCLLDTARPALVTEWGSRGSLEDVLVQDEIKLDWSFRLSLLTDLVRGMRYLHTTPARVHGRLTSRNCVIDARWVLKVTDYGLNAFYEAQGILPPQQTARELLWTAPELLRNEMLLRRGTQPGDVYSFSIVMQEVVLRGEPFCILQLKPEEIIEKLKRPPPLIRPSVSKGAAPPEAINIMRQCWAELPESRPDFNAVHDLFKTLNHGRKANFVDTMFQMLEKYSNNLEELIRERTEQLDCEKKKTEQLLNRMLPSQVADKLKMGQPVEPEDYQEVTIYFSDIVGFTAISCHSTPGQVVDLLNDLYTCFDATINAYNVYKVETIGDAYMVVGGLPVRVADHADQVATMALDLLHQSGRFQIRHLPHTPLRLRIGLHTGPCCAGVVGLTMPRYCLFGDTVNTASRMESTGSAWRIHISEATKKKLDEVNSYSIEYRGMTELKGKGLMPTYWLLGKKGFDKELPTPPPIGESHGLDESLLLPPIKPSPPAGPTPESRRRSTESCSSSCEDPLDQVSGRPANCTLPALPAPGDAVEKQANRITVCASIDNVRTPPRRGSLQLATESAKISLYTMSISGSRPGSRDLQDADLVDTLPTTSACSPTVNPAPTTSTAEVAADLLGVSFLNPPGSWRSSSTNLSGGGARDSLPHLPRSKKGPAFQVDSDDLSSGFNHYRCLMAPGQEPRGSAGHGGSAAGRGFLKRQFSLDRGDDPAGSSSGGGAGAGPSGGVARALHKQNSAGAAHDLQRIEEIPGGSGGPRSSGLFASSGGGAHHLSSVSSSESLSK